MKSKKVFIIYYGDDWGEKLPLKKSPATRLAFEDWYERGRRKGIYFYRASIDWFDISRFVFKKAWTYENKKWIKIAKPNRPNLIFDKIAGKHDYALFDLKPVVFTLAILSPMTVMELPSVLRPLIPEKSELESDIFFFLL